MNDKIVIEEGGMRFIFEKSGSSACFGCEIGQLGDYACGMCASTRSDDKHPLICTSATKIETEPKVYGPHNKDEARHLIGSTVDVFVSGSGFKPFVLWGISSLCNVENAFFIEDSSNSFATIREIPVATLTLTEARAKYGIPDSVVIEGD